MAGTTRRSRPRRARTSSRRRRPRLLRSRPADTARPSERKRRSRRWWRSRPPISIAATGGHGTVADPAAEWHQVYEEFLADEARVQRADGRADVREVPADPEEEPRRPDAAPRLQAREVLGLREGRPRVPQGHARSRVERDAKARGASRHTSLLRASAFFSDLCSRPSSCSCASYGPHRASPRDPQRALHLGRAEPSRALPRPGRAGGLPRGAPEHARAISNVTSGARTRILTRLRRPRRGRRARAAVAHHPPSRRPVALRRRTERAPRLRRARLDRAVGSQRSRPVEAASSACCRVCGRPAGRPLRASITCILQASWQREARAHAVARARSASRSASGSGASWP